MRSFVLVLVVLVLYGCSKLDGQLLFEKTCAVCHGLSGKGDGFYARILNPKPADLSSETIQKKSDEDLKKIILDGKPGTAMPSHKLSSEELNNLVKYIRTLTRFGLVEN